MSEMMLESSPGENRLGDVLAHLTAELPALGLGLVSVGSLHESLAVNLDGLRFVSDPATPIRDGQCLLILSADAGG